MRQCLLKAEGKHLGAEGAPAQCRSDLPAQQLCRRSGDRNLNPLSIHQTSQPYLPTENILHFIKEEIAGLIPVFGEQAIPGFSDLTEVLRRHGQQALVVKVEVEHGFFGNTLLQIMLHRLKQKPCFTRPAHPDNRINLAGQRG